MCCPFAILLLLGPRFGGLLWWLTQPVRWQAAFNNSWLWPVLGLIFLPWTTLVYVLVAPGGIGGLDWLWLGIAVIGDLSSYGGSAVGNRDRLGYGR